MNKGNVEQIDTPMTVYDRPKTLFVNTFIGQANLLNGTVLRLDAESTLIGLANDRTLLLPRRLNFTLGSKVTITFRPEEVRLSTQPSESTLPVRMTVSVPLGPSSSMTLPSKTVRACAPPRSEAPPHSFPNRERRYLPRSTPHGVTPFRPNRKS